jgi:ribokinase
MEGTVTAETQTGRVIVLGSANVDAVTYVSAFPKPGETVLARSARTGLGGKGANQAVAAALMGADVSFAGAVGDDASGEFVRQTLKRYSVAVTALATLPGALTGSAAIAVDLAGENTIIVASGANALVDAAWVRGPAVSQLFDAPATIGLAQGELPAAVVAEFAALCAERGTRFVLNLAPAIPMDREVLALADPLVVNELEAYAVLGEPPRDDVDAPTATLLAQRLALTCPSVVITIGAAGAVLASSTGAVHHIPSPAPAQVVDTTGAGDAFVGALVARLARGDDLATASRWGVAAGSCAVQQLGAVDSYSALATLELPGPQTAHERTSS